ncbi:MAG TPA: GNAT family N-acetyltransferase [Acetobacteraceae bacterium]|nr:GNAT family N-acetyltransferase [Acetobacteraceae bacterium]
MTGPFVVEPLGSAHDRRSFTCGVETLDRYFHQHVSQDIRRRLSNCFVAVGAGGDVAGYYTFSASSLPMTDLPADLASRLPRYPLLPAGLIGRLAVATRYARQGLGAALILDAVTRATRAEPAIFALIVDAIDDDASRFYVHLGFRPLISRPSSLYWPVAEAVRRIGASH